MKKQTGFLLFELAVFVTILAIISSIYVPRLLKRSKDLKTKAKAQLATVSILTLVESAINYVQDIGNCPSSQDDLVSQGYLKAKIFLDLDDDGTDDTGFESNADRGWGGTGKDCVLELKSIKSPAFCELLKKSLGTLFGGEGGIGDNVNCSLYTGTKMAFAIVAPDIR